MEADLIVIGSGPAGLCAASEAALHGADVVVIDENPKAGGQLFKQIHKFFGSSEQKAGVRGIDIGNRLWDECLSRGVNILLSTTAWGVFEGGTSVAVNSKEVKSGRYGCRKLVIASGARERPLIFPGWTLPGVMSAGAAQTLMNLYRVLPGRRILMVGTGNVGLIVAFQLIQAGAEIAGMVDILSAAGGFDVHFRKISRLGVPIFLGHRVKEVRGRGSVEAVVIEQVDEHFEALEGTGKVLEVDTVCIAAGLIPMIDIARISGCEIQYFPALGGWVPLHDSTMRTTMENIYVSGDVTGVEEASTAMVEGKIAGVATAESLGFIKQSSAQRRMNMFRMELEALRNSPRAEAIRKANENARKRYGLWLQNQELMTPPSEEVELCQRK